MKQFLNYWLGGKLLLALASGIMLAMCFPGYDISGLVWLWAIPLMAGLWTLEDSKRKKLKAFTLAYLGGMVFWLMNVWWLESMGDLEGVPPVSAYFAWIGLSAYLSIYFGIWGVVCATIGNPWKKSITLETEKKSRVDRAIEKKLAVSDARSNLATGGKKKFDLMCGFGTSLRVIRFALMHASFWVVLEWLRGWLFTGFTWNGVGVAFHETPTIAQAADLVGVVGLSFLPILVCSTLLQLSARLIKEAKTASFKAHWEIAFTVGLVSLAFVYGILRMGHFRSVETHPVKVLILQENIPQSIKWGDEKQQLDNYTGYIKSLDDGLAKLRKESFEAAMELKESQAAGVSVELNMLEPDVVLLPESAFTQNMYYVDAPYEINQIFLTLYDDDFLRNGLLAKGNFSVIYGSNLFQGEIKEDGMWPAVQGVSYNSIAIAPPSMKADPTNPTSQLSAYGKIHLVPFGEYFPEIPFRESIYSAIYGANPSMEFSPGTSYEPLMLQAGDREIGVIPAICFEDTVGRVTRKFVRGGKPQMIVNVTNDGWFGTSDAARQHMANAKFRAIELRRPMIRSANTGMSGVIDITGGFKDKITKKRQIVEDETGNIFVKRSLFAYARVPIDGEVTLYAALGDWFIIFCLVQFAVTVFLTKMRSNNE